MFPNHNRFRPLLNTRNMIDGWRRARSWNCIVFVCRFCQLKTFTFVVKLKKIKHVFGERPHKYFRFPVGSRAHALYIVILLRCWNFVNILIIHVRFLGRASNNGFNLSPLPWLKKLLTLPFGHNNFAIIINSYLCVESYKLNYILHSSNATAYLLFISRVNWNNSYLQYYQSKWGNKNEFIMFLINKLLL